MFHTPKERPRQVQRGCPDSEPAESGDGFGPAFSNNAADGGLVQVREEKASAGEGGASLACACYRRWGLGRIEWLGTATRGGPKAFRRRLCKSIRREVRFTIV